MGSPFKMNPKTPLMKALVGKQGNLPQHLKQAILDAPAKMTDKDKKKGTKKDTFRYESDAPEVIGTAYRKAGTERVTEYKKAGKELKKGDTYDYGGFQTPKKVVDTGRDTKGNKLAGRTGTVDVEVKKGDIRFTTGKKTKKKSTGKSPAKSTDKYGKKHSRLREKSQKLEDKAMNYPGDPKVSDKKANKLLDKSEKAKNKARAIRDNSPAKSYGKSPMKKDPKVVSKEEVKRRLQIEKDAKLKKQRGFTSGAGKGKRKVDTKTPTSIYVKKEKTASAIKPRGVDTGNKKSIGKSPAKMYGKKKK